MMGMFRLEVVFRWLLVRMLRLLEYWGSMVVMLNLVEK